MESNYVMKYKDELIANARAICLPGKGILAADESTGTIGKRFDNIKLENTETNRQAYRELLFTTPEIEKYISGVILYEETLYQSTADGKPFVKLLQEKNIIPGIKVDKGCAQILPGGRNETATQGLDDLGKRCAKYYADGARFAKWRAVLKIGDNLPTEMAILENAHGLARYAQICQENGLVPIVEPEVLVDGTHTIDDCVKASERVYAGVVKALTDFGILMEGILLKPNMITSGSECATKAPSSEVAWKTVRTLLRTIPGAIPGITFLSGGQSEIEATCNLNAMNNVDCKKPWNLTFSFGRALQHSCIKAWEGKVENVKKAQDVLIERARGNSEASLGTFKGTSDGSAGESLHVKNYVY